jgi:serine protease Do
MVSTLDSIASGLSGLSEETAALVERLRPSVVVVRNGHQGAGAGVIWTPEGLVVTNFHVAPGPRAEVVLEGGRNFAGQVVKSDRERDLAIIQIPASNLPAVTPGASTALRPGQFVFAIGNPLGLPGAVSAGIISASPSRSGRPRMIQADISLAPGNSGGPLLTASGLVVGINSMVRMPGMALAVPVEAVQALINGAAGERGYLGIALQQIALPAAWVGENTGDTGFLVTGVQPGSSAESAGVLPGDVIIGTDGDALAPVSSLAEAFEGLRPDEDIELLILRGGQACRLRIQAGRRLRPAA